MLMSTHAICHASLILLFSATAFAAGPVDFNRDVRPVLSDKCFACHGPDPATREAGMRLDTQGGLFEDRGGYAAFVPKDRESSEALRRILSEDEFERMPPPDSGKSLTPRQIEIITAWVEQGAVWQPHWAFVPPVKTAPPAVENNAWPQNAIDRFILARLESEGLAPSPAADRYTLVRRVYLDLVGLPPTPEEADAFVADESPDAYERLVDRLIASPHYGERWARRWLDLARYADTNGYEKDRPRSIWPYRDWVVDAINAGMPFDDFSVKQLAGDMLPNATIDDRIATGFHRNTMLNEEGGIDPLEFRFHAMTDRVATTGTTWLGLTTGCAQCHDHKYDPISHREYFGLMAFLNNANEPELPLPDPALDAQYAANLEQAARLLDELPSKWPAGELRWKRASILRAKSESGETPTQLDDGSVLFAAPGPDRDTYTLFVETDEPQIDRLRIETLTHDSLPAGGPGRVGHGNFVLSDVAVRYGPQGRQQRLKPARVTAATADVEQSGFPAAAAIDGNPATGWAVHAADRLNHDHAITLNFDGPIGGGQDGTRLAVTLRQQHGGRHTIGRVRISVPEGQTTAPDERREIVEQRFAEWLRQERQRTVAWSLLRPTGMSSNLPLLTLQEDASVFVTGDTTKQDTYRLSFRPSGKTPIRAILLEALPDDRLPAGGPGMTYYEGRKGDFFLTEFRLTADGKPVPVATATHNYANNQFGRNPATAPMAIDDDLQTGWSANGRAGERHTAVFVLAEPIDPAELNVEMNFGRHFASSLGRFRISVTDAATAVARDLSVDIEQLLAKPDEELTAAERNQLRDEFLLQAPELAKEAEQIRKLRKRPEPLTTLVLAERPAGNPRPTHIHNRGEYLQPTEEVGPITIEALHPFPDELPDNRLGFARWLVADENPLTARVVVNRQWAALFGRGIVSTVQDFGFQGEPPSHPELLDWLAVEFMQSGWSVKDLHRLIVTSAAYRQSSVVPAELLERDPQNILLARGPRLRLEAELIRDSALAASGLLAPKLGGEPVKPPQPDGVTEAAYGSPSWDASTGEDRYRRSLYTFIKRTAPFAMYSVFDAPSGEACTARRDISNTALQSLTLLNDIVFLEAARALGSELTAQSGNDADRVRNAFRQILTRPPTPAEEARLVEFVEAQRTRFASDDKAAAEFAGDGQGSPVERATWTALARALLSLDESVTRS